MNIEDIKTEFPEMPEDIRAMIAQTVAEQVQAETVTRGKSAHPTRRIFFIALAAALALAGTTVAAEIIHRFHSEQIGNYGVSIVVEPTEFPKATIQSTEAAPITTAEMETASEVTVSQMRIVANWLPKGVSKSETDNYHYYNEAGELVLFVMQEYTSPDGDYALEETDVACREDILVGGHEAVYLERQNLDAGGTTKYIYMHFPEEYSVVRINTVEVELDRDTMIEFAENLTLEPIHGTSFYLAGLTEGEGDQAGNSQLTEETYTAVSKEAMANTHKVGDTFSAEFSYGMGVLATLDVCISEVQTADDFSFLDPQFLESYTYEFLDGSGNLKPSTVQYIAQGDGVNTISKVVYSEDIMRKLVLVTMEVTNTTEATLEDIGLFPGIVYLEETSDGYAIAEKCISDRVKTAPNGKQYDYINETGRDSLYYVEMMYHDTEGHEGRNGSNYINELAPGETATLHIGFVVNEDMLPYLYFYADGINAPNMELNTRNLAEGYVDIRQ